MDKHEIEKTLDKHERYFDEIINWFGNEKLSADKAYARIGYLLDKISKLEFKIDTLISSMNDTTRGGESK